MRYFLEVSYKGTHFYGFQIQENAKTIQGELENALNICLKMPISLTGSSRTDTGVHAYQNYFHFDYEGIITEKNHYSLNSIISEDIVVKSIRPVRDDAHSRFDAIAREYKYHIYFKKDPFQKETAWYYPFKIDFVQLQLAANKLMGTHDFASFSKRNTQVFTHICTIDKAEWSISENGFVFTVKSNRFLRGMVRALVATMLKVGRGSFSITDFEEILDAKECGKADFSAPARGLFLMNVIYPATVFL
ncbi:MAG: tRNA pseudouridine(38-40) synthase TruA [Pseudopedobacter saltans]|uniref:tRNA pseudouridine synthase A n=1 Tax=Pseudopedobacter saltans TaxID=151895 RepID=A0A2W5GWV1_9SPHI|nr:MAG: tRNA pseudouridine(38-40) synthase TruA [Pseudopedobacter saltans]